MHDTVHWYNLSLRAETRISKYIAAYVIPRYDAVSRNLPANFHRLHSPGLRIECGVTRCGYTALYKGGLSFHTTDAESWNTRAGQPTKREYPRERFIGSRCSAFSEKRPRLVARYRRARALHGGHSTSRSGGPRRATYGSGHRPLFQGRAVAG